MRPTYRTAACAVAVIAALVPATVGSAALASVGRGAAHDARVDARPLAPAPDTDAAGGARLWLAHYTGNGSYGRLVAVSPDGSTVFVAGAPMIAYDAATGARKWTAAGSYLAYGMAVSPDGSTVFVTGYSTDASGTYQYDTVAYDAATGAQLWDSTYHGGPQAGYDVAKAITVSPDGSTVFVTGSTGGSKSVPGNGTASATIAYDAATGARLWTATGSYITDGIAVSPNGKMVYVAGGAPKVKYHRMATVALDAVTGATKWTAYYVYPPRGEPSASFVAVSPDGRYVYVSGSMSHFHAKQVYNTVAYTASTGHMQWVTHSVRGYYETSMALSPDGSELVLTGQGYTSSGQVFYATVALRAATGAQLWVRNYGGPGGSDAFGTAWSVAISPDSSKAFVTGEVCAKTGCSQGAYDYGTVAYSAATGARLWASLYPGGGTGGDSVAVSPDGSKVFVTGITGDTLAYRA